MLYIPFDHYQGQVGGPTTFMRYLHDFLLVNNVQITEDVSDPRIKTIFFPIAFDLDQLKQLKSRGCRIIQRLDGIYYPSKHGVKYRDLNRDIESIYCKLADYVVFQSRYSQLQCSAQFGNPKEFSIITNGVDSSLFPANTHVDFDYCGVIKFVTTGNFRNVDMIEPVVIALDALVAKGLRIELTVVGPVSESLVGYLHRSYITVIGNVSLDQVNNYLQKSQIFLYSHLNPPCPNSVLEAVSVGLPIVGFDSGALSELLFWQKDLLAYVSDDVFQEYRDFSSHLFTQKIIQCIDNWEVYKKEAMKYTDYYSFVRCGNQYLSLFTSTL